MKGECVTSSPRDLTIGDKGLTTLSLRSAWLVLKRCVCVAQKGKGLTLLAFDSVLVFLSMPMGFDLDCCVPYPPPSPKKFTVFRGSAILSLTLQWGCFNFTVSRRMRIVSVTDVCG